MREVPPDSAILSDDSPTMTLRTRDPREVIKALSGQNRRPVGRRPHACRCISAGRSGRSNPRVHCTGTARWTVRRGARRRGQRHRRRLTMALRRGSVDRAGSAAQPGWRRTDRVQSPAQSPVLDQIPGSAGTQQFPETLYRVADNGGVGPGACGRRPGQGEQRPHLPEVVVRPATLRTSPPPRLSSRISSISPLDTT